MNARARYESLRQRLVARGLIQDEGPADMNAVERGCRRDGVPLEKLCDQIEAFLDADTSNMRIIDLGENPADLIIIGDDGSLEMWTGDQRTVLK